MIDEKGLAEIDKHQLDEEFVKGCFVIRPINDSVYIDQFGKMYVKTRDIGYEEYGYLKEDGTYSCCGGHVGLSAGWREVDSKNQVVDPINQDNEYEKFKNKISKAKNSLDV